MTQMAFGNKNFMAMILLYSLQAKVTLNINLFLKICLEKVI